MTLLAEYVTHAEKFGVDQVYETAEAESLPELDLLATHLRRIDKTWRMTPEQLGRCIDTMRDRGFTAQRISELAEVSLSTVKRRMVEPRKSVKSEDREQHSDPPENDTAWAAQRVLDMAVNRPAPPFKNTWREYVYGGKRRGRR